MTNTMHNTPPLLSMLHRSRSLHAHGNRRGVTLIELLVVIFIMLLVTGSAIATIAPFFGGRRVREGGRMVNTYLNGARNRAMRTGRPVGVMFERLPGGPDVSMTLSYVEVPPPYAGDYIDSTIIINSSGVASFRPAPPNPDEVGWRGLLRPGDSLKLNYQGQPYKIFPTAPGETFTDSNGNNAYDLGETYTDDNGNSYYDPGEPYVDTNMNGAWDEGESFTDTNSNSRYDHMTEPPWVVYDAPIRATGAAGVPFQITRQPVKSSSGSLQLPETVVVDLTVSGALSVQDPFPVSAIDTQPIIVMFSPKGSVDQIYVGGVAVRPPSKLFFLVGTRVKAGYDPNTSGDQGVADDQVTVNWQDAGSIWISIVPQTGLVSTAENLTTDGYAVSTTAEVYTAITAARGIASSAQSMGGN